MTWLKIYGTILNADGVSFFSKATHLDDFVIYVKYKDGGNAQFYYPNESERDAAFEYLWSTL